MNSCVQPTRHVLHSETLLRPISLAAAVLVLLLLAVPPARAGRDHEVAGVTALASASAGAAFDGFGASGAWWARDTGRMRSATRSEIARLLFTKQGLGLTMYRYNLGGGGRINEARRWAPGYLRADGAYNWSADPWGRDMLSRAASLGVPRLVAFANAAPPEYTTDGRGCAGKLRADSVARYASYLARVVAHLSAAGTPLTYVSPMNEPDSSMSTCNQEGMKVPVSLRAALVTALQSALARRGSSAEVIADESSRVGDELLTETPGWLAGAGSSGTAQPSAIAYHTYDSPSLSTLAKVATLSGVTSHPAFMSELCCLVNGRFTRGYHPGMQSAMWLARAVWQNLAVARATSFSWWVALSPELGCDARSARCGTSSNSRGWDDGLVYYDRDYRGDGDQRLVLTKRYWAYAQFSRWITPGMNSHDVTGVPSDARVLVYQGNGRTVVVGLPSKGATGTTRFNLQLPWLGSATASVTRTSARRNDGSLPGVAVSGGVLPVTLPRNSVTTYVISD